MMFIIVLGLPARLVHQHLPEWYILYFGDYLWAMLIFFLVGLFFRVSSQSALISSILITYSIEVSQLFSPPWLETLRSVKIFALILGHGFLWSDIIAYTLGIGTGYFIETKLLLWGNISKAKVKEGV